ncbi:unnamed protein product [Rhizoctonia solani]|uniref:Serine aminopeptidase S33 domain-containing protein n=1 Tax=Rhizoctonia solani TaxID=456999 RepID=A0A8H2ZZP9_9AGAM|nr:unnamed protein product [Rhizoctonia solani]
MRLLNLLNGVCLSYFSYPDPLPSPSRPTILLLAAFFQSVNVQFIPQLRDASLTGAGSVGGCDFNFVGIDVHGEGETTGREKWEYLDNARDVADALTMLGVKKFFVLGSSHGGITAQELSIMYPSRVRGMILVGSTCRPYPPEFSARMRDVLVPVWTSSMPPPDIALAGSIKSTLGAPAKSPEEPGSVFGDRAYVQTDGPSARTAETVAGIELLSKIVDNWRTHVGEMRVQKPVDTMLEWQGCEGRLGSVDAPVLIIHGEDDQTIPFECSEYIFSALPKKELTRIIKMDGKGAHLINEVREIAVVMNKIVREWLDDCIKAADINFLCVTFQTCIPPQPTISQATPIGPESDCRTHVPDSPSIEEELGEKLADMKHKISDVLGKGLAVKVNNAPWQRVVMHVDEESDEEAVVILYGLMPAKHYEIELSVVAGESIKGNLRTEDELNNFDESTRAPPAVTQLNTTPQTQTVTPADTPPSSPSSSGSSSPQPRQLTVEERASQLRHMQTMLNQEHDQLTAQLKTARRDAQRADAALRSEIEALKRAVEKNAAGEQRTKQKILALQESVKQALAAAVDADNEVKELERALPGLEVQRTEAEKEHARASEAADRSATEAKAALEQDRKRTGEVEAELTALTAKVEKMTAKRDKLATENIPELERELSCIRAEIEEIEKEKEREREFNHEIDYPHHYAPQQLISRINAAAPPFVPRSGVGHSRGAASVPAVQTGPIVKPHAHTASEGFLRGYPPFGPGIDIPSQRPSGAQQSPTATENRAIGPTGTTSRKGSLPPGAERGPTWGNVYPDAPLGSSKPHLDPPPAQKWAEEGFCVLSVPASKKVDWKLAMPIIVAALEQAKELENDKSFGLIVYESDLVNAVLPHVPSVEKISCIAAYVNSGVNTPASRPLLQHITGGTATPNKESSATLYIYPLSEPSFAHPSSPNYNHTQATLAHTRTLTFLRSHIGGPIFDIESIWEAHTRFEFEGRDVAATMSTMVAEPYVNHIPTLTGGIGRKALTWFYARHFIHSNPDSTKMELVSRTLGPDRVVDEFVFEFVHDRVIDWMLPGIPPTGKHVKVPFVAVVNIRGDKLYHEHIYWDQASVLVQIGLLPEKLAFPGTTNEVRLPVAGVEQAEKMVDPGAKESNLMIKAGMARHI